ncbi:hypothetical protein, partial [Rhizobium rhizogenes]|uniref:hypothetical protein n=1 Tax=Rhizobium rhizogenes TaxID=359 RepID=UPI00137562E1
PEGEAYARRSYEAPQGEVEQALAAIWTELLGLEQVSSKRCATHTWADKPGIWADLVVRQFISGTRPLAHRSS